MCAVLAESEIINHVSEGVTVENILRGIHNSLADRALSLLKRVGMDGAVTFIGGVARQEGMVVALTGQARRRRARAGRTRIHDRARRRAPGPAAISQAGRRRNGRLKRDLIGVDPPYRGRGIGHALLQRFLDSGSQLRSIARVATLIDLGQADIREFFTRLGFRHGPMIQMEREVGAAR